MDTVIAESSFGTLNRIRVETALSRFPIHRLSKKGHIAISIKDDDMDVRWEVTHNSKHGQAGPLAYKLDTLIVNRKIDEIPRPIPKAIRLGSLYEIARQLGMGGDTSQIKRALRQNASTFVEFSIKYKRKNGGEKHLTLADNRYGVIFTGEELPDGAAADAVHISLHDWYRDLLNDVSCRPLNYDYLNELAPGAQRFYELLSFQMFGAIKHNRPRAKLLYSEYCTHAPQVRYYEREQLRKQMFKINAPHRESGYIEGVDYRETQDAEGKIDWEMLYVPGKKARDEYQAFTERTIRQQAPTRPIPKTITTPTQLTLSTLSPEDHDVLTEMKGRGIAEKQARLLLANLKPEQNVMMQLQHVDSLLKNCRVERSRTRQDFTSVSFRTTLLYQSLVET